MYVCGTAVSLRYECGDPVAVLCDACVCVCVVHTAFVDKRYVRAYMLDAALCGRWVGKRGVRTVDSVFAR